jgi:hypothetical protein
MKFEEKLRRLDMTETYTAFDVQTCEVHTDAVNLHARRTLELDRGRLRRARPSPTVVTMCLAQSVTAPIDGTRNAARLVPSRMPQWLDEYGTRQWKRWNKAFD